MSFRYNPVKTEEEAQKAREFPLLPDGVYAFEVIETKFQYSNANNPCINLKISIEHEGKVFTPYDMLIGTTNMEWKTKHFCEAVGIQDRYAAGKFDENAALGHSGKCIIANQERRPNPNKPGQFYNARNVVEDYCGETWEAENKEGFGGGFKQPAAATEPHDDGFGDKDIPF